MSHRKKAQDFEYCECVREPCYSPASGMDQVIHEFFDNHLKFGIVKFPCDRKVILVDAGQAATLMATPEGADVLRREFEAILDEAFPNREVFSKRKA